MQILIFRNLMLRATSYHRFGMYCSWRDSQILNLYACRTRISQTILCVIFATIKHMSYTIYQIYYNMRIRTIKRNTNFLSKLLQSRNFENEDNIEMDISHLMNRLKRLQKRRDDIGLPTPFIDQQDVRILK